MISGFVIIPPRYAPEILSKWSCYVLNNYLEKKKTNNVAFKETKMIKTHMSWNGLAAYVHL